MAPEIKPKSEVKYYPDGGLSVTPGGDNPIAEIQGKEFFRLLEGGYATAPDENGIRIRFPQPENTNVATLIIERVLGDGSLEEISREVFK